jgi:hypothetical protein
MEIFHKTINIRMVFTALGGTLVIEENQDNLREFKVMFQ